MNQIKLYFDEDATHSRLVAALRSRGVIAITARTPVSPRSLTTYSWQLAFATERGCVLYTFNVSDFYRLHTPWVGAGRGHAGMILAPQQRFSVGEQLRRLLHLRATRTIATMPNQVARLAGDAPTWLNDRLARLEVQAGIWLPTLDTFRTFVA